MWNSKILFIFRVLHRNNEFTVPQHQSTDIKLFVIWLFCFGKLCFCSCQPDIIMFTMIQDCDSNHDSSTIIIKKIQPCSAKINYQL